MKIYDPELNVKITNDAREYFKLASEHLDKSEIIKEFDSLQELNMFEKKNKINIINIDYINKIWVVTYK